MLCRIVIPLVDTGPPEYLHKVGATKPALTTQEASMFFFFYY